MTSVKRVTKFLGCALLICGCCHFMCTGSPIPLWHLETLKSPQEVQEITDEFLVLDNGQKVKLPMIQRIAANQPLFCLATEQGVEIQNDGELIGLVWVERNCGNDPCVWYRLRVNLSEWSAVLEPTGIESGKLSEDEIQFLADRAEEKIDQRQRSQQRRKLAIWDISDMRRIRRVFDAANGIDESTKIFRRSGSRLTSNKSL